MSNAEDLTILLRDTLDDLADLAFVSTNSAQQQALRVSAGRLIAQLQQQLVNALDYERALFTCEITPTVAEHYKYIYLEATREHVEVQA